MIMYGKYIESMLLVNQRKMVYSFPVKQQTKHYYDIFLLIDNTYR
jgi:hypothetical protein